MNPQIKTYYYEQGLGQFDTLAEYQAAQAKREHQTQYARLLQKFWRNILFKRSWKVCEGEIWVRHADLGTDHYHYGSCIFTHCGLCERCRDESSGFYYRECWQYDSDDPVRCQCHKCEGIKCLPY